MATRSEPSFSGQASHPCMSADTPLVASTNDISLQPLRYALLAMLQLLPQLREQERTHQADMPGMFVLLTYTPWRR